MQEKEKEKGKQKDKGKERKKGPYWICGGDYFKKECSNRNTKDKKGCNSANTVKKDNDYAFTVEKTLDDKRSMYVSECEEIPDKSWYEEEFEEEIKDQSDIEELAAKEIVSNIELITTQTEIFDSSTTTHITSYWNNFFAFQSIAPKVLCVREPNSMPELSQLLFVQRLTKRTRWSSCLFFYYLYISLQWLCTYPPMVLMLPQSCDPL